MTATGGPGPDKNIGVTKPSEDFAAYCEAEFDRRLNSGEPFNQAQYRKAMDMVLDRLVRLETEGKP